ncbi:CatB-related O-acetyltransferase [Falsiroseomonas sp.]|uniref:CatB-related O-acetyltransferase n=1 Tax=Falsiroseomonas sp. TaxID=2870721 RepID=UPI003F71AC6C
MSQAPGPKRTGSFTCTWSAEIEDFFRRRRVFLAHPLKVEGVFQHGETVSLPYAWQTEAYSAMPRRGTASLGAFSYSHSPGLQAGRYCSLAARIAVSADEHPMQRVSTHVFSYRGSFQSFGAAEFGKHYPLRPFAVMGPAPVIGHDVWIGQEALLKRGITIGHGAVVGARAIVTRDVPPYAIVAGSPARIKRFRFEEKVIARLLDLAWWRYRYTDFADLDPEDIAGFIDQLSARVASGAVTELPENWIFPAVELEALLA